MSIQLWGAAEHRDLPKRTKVRIHLKGDTVVVGHLMSPIATTTVREGLGGFHFHLGNEDGRLSVSLGDVRMVEVISYPKPEEEYVDNWPNGTVLVRPEGSSRTASAYLKVGQTWFAGYQSVNYSDIRRDELLVYGPTGAKVTR